MNLTKVKIVEDYFKNRAFDMITPPCGVLKYPYIDPGAQYKGDSWDWDSYFSAIALMEICEYFKNDRDFDYEARRTSVIESAKGYILNFLDVQLSDGFIPIRIQEKMMENHDWAEAHFKNDYENQHKPFLCQGVRNVSQYANDYTWFNIEALVKYIDYYREKQFHERSGLYIWKSDYMIGIDNNPTVFGWPSGSTGDIYLNSFMYLELVALAELLVIRGDEREKIYRDEAERLKETIRQECYDERDGIYYSVFVELAKEHGGSIHSGIEFFWKSVPIKVRFAGCFLPMYAGISTEEENKIMIEKHFLDEAFLSPNGLRSTACDEKMYYLGGTSNPSNSWGPIWLIYNYIAFHSLIKAGRKDLAKDLCEKMVNLYADDILKTGKVDECYDPMTGEPIMNKSFLSWNCLIIQMLNELREDYIYPLECKAIIDVTKPPYNLDNTGKTDCTEKLCALVDEVLGAYEANFYKTKEKLESMEDDNALISFEIRKVNGRSNVIFPEELPASKIIYFPNGTYLVSDTISYSMEEFRNLMGSVRYLEMNCQLRFMGQSRDGVVIKLKDHCKGFGFGNDRPVIDFMRGEQSNIAMTNMLENLTIDIGVGNPGATGVRYFANNTGAIRNVKIVSSDPEFRGHTGLSVLHTKVSAGYTKNIEIVGFQYGIRVASRYIFSTFEHVVLKHQKRVGMYIEGNNVAVRDIYSENFVPALKVDGLTACVVVTDARLLGGNPLDAAIKHMFGHLMLRNISCEGYENALQSGWKNSPKTAKQGRIDEWVTYGPKTVFGANEEARSLQLSVEETPEVVWDEPDDWISVNEFGAVGDGVSDDTEAIQKAFASGKSTIYFQPGCYLIDDVVEIPSSVSRVNFMYSDLRTGENLEKRKHTGAFLIKEESEKPLIIEDLFAWEKFKGFVSLIEHASARTLILSDVHVQTASMYFNTVPGGKVFMENTGCTIGGIPGAGRRSEPLPHEDWESYSRETPCFYFKGQEVYCRQINPERSLHEVINDGGKLWVLGCKTEEEGTAFETRNGGSTEILGAVFVIGAGKDHPAIINDNSDVSVFASTLAMGRSQNWPIAVREIQKERSGELRQQDMPALFIENYVVPLYVGRR